MTVGRPECLRLRTAFDSSSASGDGAPRERRGASAPCSQTTRRIVVDRVPGVPDPRQHRSLSSQYMKKRSSKPPTSSSAARRTRRQAPVSHSTASGARRTSADRGSPRRPSSREAGAAAGRVPAHTLTQTREPAQRVVESTRRSHESRADDAPALGALLTPAARGR